MYRAHLSGGGEWHLAPPDTLVPAAAPGYVRRRNTYPDGRTYIGTGIVPDVAVPITANDVRVGRDAALEIAFAILRERVPPAR
jgi:hypothetical protein